MNTGPTAHPIGRERTPADSRFLPRSYRVRLSLLWGQVPCRSVQKTALVLRPCELLARSAISWDACNVGCDCSGGLLAPRRFGGCFERRPAVVPTEYDDSESSRSQQ